MNYPVQYPPATYPPAPPAPQQYVEPAPQQFAPQYPGYPAQQGYPGVPQPYAAPVQAPAAPPVPLAQGSLDAFYNQPSTGGGAGLKFTDTNSNQPMVGQSYVFQVTRPLTGGDVQQQTDNQNRPLFYKDGRPKFVLIVPVQLLEPSPNHPDGLAKWYVKGGARDELNRAMHEAGAPEGAPEAGAVIRVTLTGTRQSGPGMNPAHVFSVVYVRPEGAAPAPSSGATSPAPVAQPQAQQAFVPEQVAPQGQPEPQYAQQAPAAQPAFQGVPVAPAQQVQAPAAPQFQAPQAAAPQPPANLSPEQQALLARLKGQQG